MDSLKQSESSQSSSPSPSSSSNRPRRRRHHHAARRRPHPSRARATVRHRRHRLDLLRAPCLRDHRLDATEHNDRRNRSTVAVASLVRRRRLARRSIGRARASSWARGRDSLVSHTPWYDESMGHERSGVPHRATTAPMDDAWMTTADYDASTRDKRAVRDATTAKARVCVRRRPHRANETRTRRERDANETRTRRERDASGISRRR